MSHRQLHKPTQRLKIGLCSVILGLGSLMMTIGQAGAVPLTVMVSDSTTSFTVVEQSGGTPGDGVDERSIGTFNFTGDPNYSTFSGPLMALTGAELTIKLTGRDGLVSSDAFWLGGTLLDANTNHPEVQRVQGLPELFLFNVNGQTPNAGFQVPDLNTEQTYIINLLNFYSPGALMGEVMGGDTAGGIYLRYGDDAELTYASLKLTAIQNPEPASLLLLGTGMLGLAAWRWRKREPSL